MRLVACPACRTQFDVADVTADSIVCACGQRIENRPLSAIEAAICRCGSCGALVGAQDATCGYCGAEIVRDERRLSLICPECYARNDEKARFCAACGVAFRPRPIPSAGRGPGCPDCEKELSPRDVAGTRAWECPRCQGLWVARFEELVGRALEARRRALEAGEAEPLPRVQGGNPVTSRVRYRRCPDCSTLMTRANFRRTSGVIVDRCPDHGTWLDADELEQIAGFVLSGGIERAKAAELTTMRTASAGTPPPAPGRAEAEFRRILMDRRPSIGFGRLVDGFVGLMNELLP